MDGKIRWVDTTWVGKLLVGVVLAGWFFGGDIVG